MIKSKQLENTLRSESNPFDTVYSDKTVGDLNGAIRFTATILAQQSQHTK